MTSSRSALRAVQNAAIAANLGHVTAHDLRHSLVANALDAGLTLAEAARLAGHASPAVTASVYADVLEANRESLGAKLAQTGFGGDTRDLMRRVGAAELADGLVEASGRSRLLT